MLVTRQYGTFGNTRLTRFQGHFCIQYRKHTETRAGKAAAPAPWAQCFSVIRENLRMSLQEPSHNSSISQPEPHARKKPLSESKILANRKNALRSSGPKTERGKRAVSRNAIKHGLLAREVVITAGDGEESLEEFHALVEGLEKCYAPVGTIEETFVQTIATCMWR